MQNSVMLFTFIGFDWKYYFLGKFGQKNKNYQFKLKFGTYASSNMGNSMVIFTFSVFDWKYPFVANLVQKVKIVSLKSDPDLPNKNVLFASLKNDKKCFFFILKALFVLKMFKFLSLYFGHVEKTA